MTDIDISGSLYNNELQTIDWDNNGDDELLFVDDDGIKIYDYNVSDGTFAKVFSNPMKGKLYVGDLSGDGINDIMIINDSKIKVFVGVHTPGNTVPFTFDLSNFALMLSSTQSIRAISDFNGDGVMEVLTQGSTYNSFGLYDFSVQTGFNKIKDFIINDIPNPTDQAAVYYKDFNGDNKTDICFLSKVSGALRRTTCFSFGNGFLPLQESPELFPEDPPFCVEDINNDGRADFVKLWFSNGKLYFIIQFTKPDGISHETVNSSIDWTFEFSRILFFPGIINPNGTMGFIIALANKIMVDAEPALPSYETLSIHTLMDNGTGSNVLKSIVDGFGITSRINYSYFGTTGPLYANFPIAKPKFRDITVSETYIEGANNAIWCRRAYSYDSPLIHLLGKGSLGFRETKVTSFDNSTIVNSRNELLISNSRYYFLYPSKTSTWSMKNGNTDKLLSENVNTYEIKVNSTGALNFMPVLTKSVGKNWDNDESHSYIGIVIEETDPAYIDNYGNIGKRRTLKDESEVTGSPTESCSWEQTVLTSFVPADENNWLVSLPSTSQTTTYHKPEESTIESTISNKVLYHYYDSSHASFPLLEYKENIPNGNTMLSNENWYSYDRYGNITGETLKAYINGTTEERKVEFTYPETNGYNGRFLTSKTVKAEFPVDDQTTTYTYNPVTGRMLTSTNLNQVGTSTYEYDSQGILVKTTYPDGTSGEINISWVTDPTMDPKPPAGALFYSISNKRLNGTSQKWNKAYSFFDKYSRLMRSSVQGFDGTFINTDTEYDIEGRLLRVSEPYHAASPPKDFQWTTNTYDLLGRVVQQQLPTGAIIKKDFVGRTVKITNQATSLWKEVTYNILGDDDLVKDPTGGNISYNYDAAFRVRTMDAAGAVTRFEYDDAGNRTKVIDPDARIITSQYNALGELTVQTDSRGAVTNTVYDKQGRVKTTSLVPDNTLTTYSYCEGGEPGFGQLKSIQKTTLGGNETKINYQYDNLGRLISKTESFEGKTFTFGYQYDSQSGLMEFYTYPSQYKIQYGYNMYGFLDQIKEAETQSVLWKANETNARGQLTKTTLGNGLITQKTFDPYGLPKSITTHDPNSQRDIRELFYSWDEFTGNLKTKVERTGPEFALGESYEYDPVLKSRLTSWQVNSGGSPKYEVQYLDNGNIQSKTDVTLPFQNGNNIGPDKGQYIYGENAGPHAVTGVHLPTPAYLASASHQTISYNGLNQISTIIKGPEDIWLTRLDIVYGADNKRIKSTLSKIYDHSVSLLKTKYFLDDYEIEINNVTKERRELHYISGGDGIFAIMEKKNNSITPFYIHTDYQGTYNLITNANGEKVELLSFDPWGRRRNPISWTYDNLPTSFVFDRGYTGHEHLDQFNLINMNGRMFDPYLARFLSPDPVLPDAGDRQSHNRYSYCLNNPLKYTDPSGFKQLGDPYSPGPFVDLPGGNGTDGGGRIGPGSSHHWSDGDRTPLNNMYLGNTKSFDNLYGAGNYDQIIKIYDVVKKESQHDGSTGFWVDWTDILKIEPNALQGVEIGSTFIKIENTEQGKRGSKFFEADVRFISENIPYNSYFAGAINTKQSTYEVYLKYGLHSIAGQLLMHEFGHFLQNKYGGSLWYNLNVVPTSVININLDENKAHAYYLYNRTWTEIQANTMAYYYFNYPSFWDFNNYPVNFNYISDELKSNLYYKK